MSAAMTKRQRLDALWSQMDQEIQSFISHWRDISRVVRPRRGRFTPSDVNRGDRQNRDIIDATGTMASRTLRAGMLAGMTPPQRQWFQLETGDPELNESFAVKEWLYTVTQRMQTALLGSGIYKDLPILYGDMGDFGTGALLIEEDFRKVLRSTVLPLGTFRIANDESLKVRVFAREFRMTVRQVLEKFGKRNSAYDSANRDSHYDWDNLSGAVRTAYCNGNLETWIDIRHVIEPNADFDRDSPHPKHKKFYSCYFEVGSAATGGSNSNGMSENDRSKYLSESGYDYFPVLCPRWEVAGEDVYGTDCPGMTALGDVRQLQAGEKKALKAIDKMIDPPLQGPAELVNRKISILPGDFTATNSREGQQGLRPVHEVQFRLEAMENKQAQVRERVNEAYYKNVFLLISEDERKQRATAMEITERREEKFLALGHIYTQVEQELLIDLVEILFIIGDRQGMFPPPPEELQGLDLKIKFLSIMAQAQKIVGITSVERFFSFANNMAAVFPDVLHKVDAFEALDAVADMTSLPPKILKTNEEANAARQQQQQAIAAQQKMEAMEQMAGAAKDLSQSDMDGDSALTRLTDQANAGNLMPARTG